MEILPVLQRGTLVLLVAPHAASEEISAVIARLALRGQVTVLDGGNRLQPYPITRLLRRWTKDIHVPAERISIRRAFTCYQMMAMLESTPPQSHPMLITDLLGGFYDAHVSISEIHRVLNAVISHLERLRKTAPLLITLAPAPLPERAFLTGKIRQRADHLFLIEPSTPALQQPSLFGD